jgi:hypothetical protein
MDITHICVQRKEESLTAAFVGGHSPLDSTVELTYFKQIALTSGSVIMSGEVRCNRAMSLT